MKTIPTFKVGEKILVGKEAIEAWRSQTAVCACNSHGDEAHALNGTCNDLPAKWLGCKNCSGQAVGRPLIYRPGCDGQI